MRRAARRTWPALAAAALLAACFTSRAIERRDWGAVPTYETVRVTTVDGAQRDLTGVTVYEEGVVGVEAGASDAATGDSVRIPLDQVELLEVRSFSLARTALATVAVGGAIAVIVALGEDDTRPEPRETSCPFLYSFDGDGYVLDSETFAGGAARALERTDVDNLEHAVAVDGQYRFLLTNERPETQYTDELALVVVDHRAGTTLLPDREGRLHAVQDLRAPASAPARHGGDATRAIAARDDSAWAGAPVETLDPAFDEQLRDGLVLTFRRPAADRALLAVSARNTLLAPYALRALLELQGDSLGSWYHRLARDPELRARLTGWFARDGALRASVLVDGQWVLQDALPGVGPNVAKGQVARLDLSGVADDSVRVRLEWARGLWIIDHAALGTAAPEGIARRETVALRVDATDVDTTRMRAAATTRRLARPDGDYYVALPGDTLRLTADAPAGPAPGLARSLLLRSRGHYLLHSDHTGAPRNDVADRILRKPLFGNRFILERWRAEAGSGEEGGG